ncbi:N-terminal phage integrase SAM-like domain-containing protein [Aneurinibacillus thermoaerophilus]|uniref:Core-binding (CB) domain-containing protein n=1 Tax=Aneurinibacillus thermoaerophilus TaxID=143495 RepID=A0ABX8YAZ4_ANETH|nr:hypothetical protein K3F53_00100 [Aneurinibacillus thermoaerophilus]
MFVEPSNETFGIYLENWLEDKKTQVRPSTWKSYRWLVRRILPYLGHVPITNLKPQQL